MMATMNPPSTVREICTIILSSVFLAFVYNAFSSKPLPLIRSGPKKIMASDSALFTSRDTTEYEALTDTSKQPRLRIIAPLHERVLRNPDSVAATVRHEKSDPFLKIVTLPQVKRLLAEGRSMFIDARESDAYRKGHIEGARNIFGLEADQHFEELVYIPRDTLIVIYCSNPQCELGRMLAEFMSGLGFTNFYLYDDGWDGWIEAKMPVDSAGVDK